MDILDQIIKHKKEEVRLQKTRISIRELEAGSFFSRDCFSMKKSLEQSSTGIIAEFKRKSPSKGWIHPGASPENVVPAYEAAGASGCSILTDHHFFGGRPEDLTAIREKAGLPVLRKDFIVDEYQLIEAKSIGADVILLIAANLSIEETKKLAQTAKQLGLEVLLELHHERELDHLNPWIDMVGVNNRDLKSFQVSLEPSLKLISKLPGDLVKISESGISDPDSVIQLRQAGFRGFLMGENFMKDPDPGAACRDFIERLKSKKEESC